MYATAISGDNHDYKLKSLCPFDDTYNQKCIPIHQRALFYAFTMGSAWAHSSHSCCHDVHDSCLHAAFAFTPRILAGASVVCVCALVLPSPRHRGWGLGCVCFRGVSLYSANPGSGAWCVCLCANFAFNPPIGPGICGVWVYALVLPLPRRSLLGFVAGVLVPLASLGLWPRTPHTRRNATHRAGTQVIRSQVAQDTAHATQCTEGAHR